MGPKIATFSGHKDCVYALCEGPSESEFFSSGADGWIVLWHVDRPEEGRLIARMSASVYALHYFQEHHLILVGVNQDGLHLIDLNSGNDIWNMPRPGVNWFRFDSLDENRILAAGSKGNLLLFNALTKSVSHLSVSDSDIRALSVCQKNNHFATGNSNGEIRIFNSLTLEETAGFTSHANTVFGLGWFPDGQYLVSCGRDAKLKLWNCENGYQPELETEIPAHLFGIHDVKVHPTKPILATGSTDKTIKIWDAETLKLLRVLDKSRHAGHGHSINQILWLGKRELLLSCSDDRTISAWDIYV